MNKLTITSGGIPEIKLKIITILFIGVIILSLPLNFSNNSTISNATSSKYSTEVATIDAGMGASMDHTAADWELVEEVECGLGITKGEDLYVKVSPRSAPDHRLGITPQLDHTDFLSVKAKDALSEAPEWLRPELTEKFIDLAQIEINLGMDATGAFGDLDGDGDIDIVCGSGMENLIYIENRGTAYQPIYLKNETLFAEIDPEYNYPGDLCLGDLDADSDLDMLLGTSWGDIYYFINTGDAHTPQFNFSDIVISSQLDYPSPFLADLNYDSDLDLIFGSQNGRIEYYENVGTTQHYAWASPMTSSFSSIDVGDRSKPVLADLDNDGDFDLTIGEAEDSINYYENIGSAWNPSWRFDSTIYFNLPLQIQTSPELVDINGDRCLDLVVGGNTGMFDTFKNLGSAYTPQWQYWSSYSIFPGIAYYYPSLTLDWIKNGSLDNYAQTILDAENNLKDEIAFSIAHTATEELSYQSTYEVFKRNAELLYEIDEVLDYAKIIDYGTFVDKDYYSTVEYKYKTGNSSTIQTIELPRDIYYWYIVHPKITDESPGFIDPETGNIVAPPTGRFWREYLFYHNDTDYPLDPATDPDEDGIPNYHYPKTESPPLLKEKLEGIDYLYDSEPYNAPRGYNNDGYNNSRSWGYKDHAIEALSNWVAKTLPLNEQESADGERPIQPVRIAHHHNGNCGELQDLTVAAARTALIPAAGVMLWGEDHVWSEFYERGWHQWDNYWSDGGSVVDNFMNYWVGWGQRGGSGVTKWHGDDYISDVTDSYVPEEDLSILTVHVTDRNGYAVDGARVMVGSHWTTEQMSGYQVSLPFPSIWNYTDNDGVCIFKVATQEGRPEGNKNFSFKIISKVGNAEQGKTELEHGQDYEFWFSLDGMVPETGIYSNDLEIPPGKDRFKLEVSYEITGAYQLPPNPMVFNYHEQPITTAHYVSSFICNETHYNSYLEGSGYIYECYHLETNVQFGNISFELLDNDDWYFVVYNRNSIETYKNVHIVAKLYEKPDFAPVVSILDPGSNETFEVGDEILFTGQARDDREIVMLTLIIDNEHIYDLTDSLVDDTWEYNWNTSGFHNGTYNITVKAEDTNENQAWAIVQIILEPSPPPPPADETPPSIEILNPLNGTRYTIGDIILLSGSASDDVGLKSLTLTLNSKSIDLFNTLDNTTWSYSWDSTGKKAGEFKFKIRGTDKAGNMARAYGFFNLNEEYIDSKPPVITINKPQPGQIFGHEEKIVFEGTVEDDIGVALLEIKIDGGQWQAITNSIAGSSWIYVWSTEGVYLGSHTVYVRAIDWSENSEEDSIVINLIDITPPEISITNPTQGATLEPGTQIELKGNMNDNVGVEKILITIIGVSETEKIKRGIGLEDTEWSYNWDVPDYYPAGDYEVTVTATDLTGNSDTDSITISIVSGITPKEDKGWFGLPGFENWILILVLIGIVFIFHRHQNKNK